MPNDERKVKKLAKRLEKDFPERKKPTAFQKFKAKAKGRKALRMAVRKEAQKQERAERAKERLERLSRQEVKRASRSRRFRKALAQAGKRTTDKAVANLKARQKQAQAERAKRPPGPFGF